MDAPVLALYVCHNQHISGLECAHASVHQFMSTLLSMSAPPPLNTFVETMATYVWHCEFVTITLFLVSDLG